MLLLSCIFDAVIGIHSVSSAGMRPSATLAAQSNTNPTNQIQFHQIQSNFNPENGVFAIVVIIPPQMALANFERSMQLINTNKMQSDESAKSKAIESHSCHDDDDDR